MDWPVDETVFRYLGIRRQYPMLPAVDALACARTSGPLLAGLIDTLEQVGCQFWACDGPTLEPVPMVTCHVCGELALVRVAAGRPPRRADELTCGERTERRHRDYVAANTGRGRQ